MKPQLWWCPGTAYTVRLAVKETSYSFEIVEHRWIEAIRPFHWRGVISWHKIRSRKMAFASGRTLELCGISSALWHQSRNVHTIKLRCRYCGWLKSLQSLFFNTQFSNYPVSISWLEITRDYLMTPYSPYQSQVEIILALTKSTVSSYFFVQTSFLRLTAFVQCNVRVTALKFYLKLPQFTPMVYKIDTRCTTILMTLLTHPITTTAPVEDAPGQ